MTDKQKKMLLSMFIPLLDIDQVLAAEKLVIVTFNDKRVPKDAAKVAIGLISYWKMIHRAAFHGTSVCISPDGINVSFDCRKYLKN